MDLKIRFGIKFCSRFTFPEVCTTQNHQNYMKLRYSDAIWTLFGRYSHAIRTLFGNHLDTNLILPRGLVLAKLHMHVHCRYVRNVNGQMTDKQTDRWMDTQTDEQASRRNSVTENPQFFQRDPPKPCSLHHELWISNRNAL